MDTKVLEELRRLAAPEDEVLTRVRQRAGKLAPAPEIGALLGWLARSAGAVSAVEVGSAGGLSGLWLVRALTGRRALTSIEPDPYAHSLASDAYAEDGVEAHVRSILGEPATVLPRLSDGAYDLVVIQTDPVRGTDHPAHAARLLRPGGVAVFRGVARGGELADASAELLVGIVEHLLFDTVVLPIADGLAVCRRELTAREDD